MNKLRSIIVANRNFLLCYCFFFLVGLVFLLTAGKSATFIYLNPYHQSILDLFFINFTYLGDGLFAVAVILLLLAFLAVGTAANLERNFQRLSTH